MRKDDKKVKQFNVYLPPDLIRDIKFYAIETESSLSSIVTDALREHLAKKRKSKRRPNGNEGN